MIYLDRNNLHGFALSKFLPASGFKWIGHKEFELNRYTGNSWKVCVLEVDLEYSKKLHKLHNDYPLAPDKIEIKTNMLSNYQLKIAEFCDISIGNVKKLVPNFFDVEKYVLHQENLQLYLRLRLKLKKIHRVLEFNQSQWLKLYVEFNTKKEWEQKKKWRQRWKSIAQINEKCYIQKNSGKLEKKNRRTSKPSYMSQKVFENNLVAICKNNVTLTLNKPLECIVQINVQIPL